MPATDHIRNKLSQLPHKPGVYLMKDRFGTVIYVGKALSFLRMCSEFGTAPLCQRSGGK